jgi:hypothetical protein
MIWPQNVLAFARAIAKAEGSNPEWNNPGDLTGADAGNYPTHGTVNEDGVLRFVTYEDGEDALCRKCARILGGQSEVYPPEMTLAAGGLKYSHNDPNWAINVGRELNVPTTITFGELAKLTLPCVTSNTSA